MCKLCVRVQIYIYIRIHVRTQHSNTSQYVHVYILCSHALYIHGRSSRVASRRLHLPGHFQRAKPQWSAGMLRIWNIPPAFRFVRWDSECSVAKVSVCSRAGVYIAYAHLSPNRERQKERGSSRFLPKTNNNEIICARECGTRSVSWVAET